MNCHLPIIRLQQIRGTAVVVAAAGKVDVGKRRSNEETTPGVSLLFRHKQYLYSGLSAGPLCLSYSLIHLTHSFEMH